MQEPVFVSKAKVELMGRQYTLKGDVDPEYMVTLAGYINGKLKEIKEIAPDADPVRQLLLVSLNLADELHQAKNKDNQGADTEDLERLQEKTSNLIEMLEDGLVGEY